MTTFQHFLTISTLAVLHHAASSAYVPEEIFVETALGYVRGSTHLSRSGREYNSFRGIPYAKPPLGKLRFKAPEPPEPWESPLDATKDGPYCIQIHSFFGHDKVEGQEDCLYLNVYVPETAAYSKYLLPVMVFIHWGGFFSGRGTSNYLGPEYFMDQDVVLVTLNYRLGVMGFLSTVDDAAPGNFGLKDQVMALRFVQDNIRAFGGDRNRVTLFGQSAGSGSVSLHLASPASKGLFQQAISQSGVELNLWARPLNVLQPNVTAAQAIFVNCSSHIGNNEALVDCLRNVSAEDLVASSQYFKVFSIEPLTPFSVVTETKTVANPDPFLTEDPLNLLKSGDFQRIPWMVGTNQDEGILRASAILRQSNTREILNKNLSSIITQTLALQLSGGPNTESLVLNITDFYLGGKKYVDVEDPQSVQGFINLYSDRAFLYGTYQSILLHSLRNHTPIWVYNFDYRGENSYGDQFASTKENINFDWGVSHCDDLIYLFKSPAFLPELQDQTDICMSFKLIILWTNFATYGDPDPNKELGWYPLKFKSTEDIRNENLSFLNITGSSVTSTIKFTIQSGGYFKDRVRFWESQQLLENFEFV